MSVTILNADCRTALAGVDAGSVRMCVTSPPYYGLRDYEEEGQIGLEETVDEYVDELVSVFGAVRRVLADDGTLWLNLGDSYNGSGGNHKAHHKNDTGFQGEIGPSRGGRGNRIATLPSKNLIGIPWRVAFALQADGWYLRSDIIWHKPNPMPESVTDRPTGSHEYLFLLSKQGSYFYEADAIKERALTNDPRPRNRDDGKMNQTPGRTRMGGLKHNDYEWRNKRSVWTVSTVPSHDAHFAVFPEKLVEPCILAGSAMGDTVLDPFTGSGTVGVVALRHHRKFLGVELNPKYCEIVERRLGAVQPVLA